MNSLVGEPMAIEKEHVLLAAERGMEPAQIGRSRRKSLREVHSEQQGKVSDKWLRYLDIYEAAFANIRDQPVRILEIGVQNGGSLEVSAKYFPRAIAIIGCDINPECAKLRYNNDRIKLVIGDAFSASAEREIVAHSAEFDIIIDDGSHKSSDISSASLAISVTLPTLVSTSSRICIAAIGMPSRAVYTTRIPRFRSSSGSSTSPTASTGAYHGRG